MSGGQRVAYWGAVVSLLAVVAAGSFIVGRVTRTPQADRRAVYSAAFRLAQAQGRAQAYPDGWGAGRVAGLSSGRVSGRRDGASQGLAQARRELAGAAKGGSNVPGRSP